MDKTTSNKNNNNNQSGFMQFLNSSILLPGILFALLVVIVRVGIFKNYVDDLIHDDDFKLIENFIEWFGVAYGLLIALVMVEVWSQHDAVEREFDREADAVSMFYHVANQIQEGKGNGKETPLGLKNQIQKSTRNYVEHVLQYFAQEHESVDIRERGDTIIEMIGSHIEKLIHLKVNVEVDAITSELVKQYNDLVDVRGDRISRSKRTMPKPVWKISVLSSILWIIPFLLLNFRDSFIAILFEGGVIFVVVSILAIIWDLNYPFTGVWNIEIDDWETLGEYVKLKNKVLLIYNINNSNLSIFGAQIAKYLRGNQPCNLFWLLRKKKQRTDFIEKIKRESNVFVQVLHRDEFYRDYQTTLSGNTTKEMAFGAGKEKITFPVILWKSGRTIDGKFSGKILMNHSAINQCGSLDDLKERINSDLKELIKQ